MLLDLPLPQLISIISNDMSLRTHIDDALELISLEEAAAQAQQQRKSITRAISTPNLPGKLHLSLSFGTFFRCFCLKQSSLQAKACLLLITFPIRCQLILFLNVVTV